MLVNAMLLKEQMKVKKTKIMMSLHLPITKTSRKSWKSTNRPKEKKQVPLTIDHLFLSCRLKRKKEMWTEMMRKLMKAKCQTRTRARLEKKDLSATMEPAMSSSNSWNLKTKGKSALKVQTANDPNKA